MVVDPRKLPTPSWRALGTCNSTLDQWITDGWAGTRASNGSTSPGELLWTSRGSVVRRRAEDATRLHDEASDVEDHGVLRRRVGIESTRRRASGFFERCGVFPLGDRLLAGALKRRCVGEGRHRPVGERLAGTTHPHHAP